MDYGNLKVLIVDDEPDIRTIGILSLTKLAGWTVLESSNGVEALALAREELPDVILLDVMMPGMDGPTTLQQLLADERTAKIPVIFCTAKVLRDEIDAYLRLGAAGVVSKPFDPISLPKEIKMVVDGI